MTPADFSKIHALLDGAKGNARRFAALTAAQPVCVQCRYSPVDVDNAAANKAKLCKKCCADRMQGCGKVQS